MRERAMQVIKGEIDKHASFHIDKIKFKTAQSYTAASKNNKKKSCHYLGESKPYLTPQKKNRRGTGPPDPLLLRHWPQASHQLNPVLTLCL